jgi:hypothetical protein
MMAEVVAALGHGAVAERMQDLSAGRPRRRATWALKRELRRVARARRRDPVPLTVRPAVP